MERSLICHELQTLQRQRAFTMKMTNMQMNALRAFVASNVLGYTTGMEPAERKKKFKEADGIISKVKKGDATIPYLELIQTGLQAIRVWETVKAGHEKQMRLLAADLPVASWVEQPAQRGFGLLGLAIVVGECGDLSNYSGPAKVWKRLGCAPYTFQGQTLMGSTWRRGKQGSLPASEWAQFGYSPRRRSISYLLGSGLQKQNQDGPYRARYEFKKAELQSIHPDYTPMRCELHGLLLAAKLLLKNLWIEWNGHPPMPKFQPVCERELTATA